MNSQWECGIQRWKEMMMRCSWLDLQALMKSSRILNIHPYEQVRKWSRKYTINGIFSAQKRERKRWETMFLTLTWVVDWESKMLEHFSLLCTSLELEIWRRWWRSWKSFWGFYGREREPRGAEGEEEVVWCLALVASNIKIFCISLVLFGTL